MLDNQNQNIPNTMFSNSVSQSVEVPQSEDLPPSLGEIKDLSESLKLSAPTKNALVDDINYSNRIMPQSDILDNYENNIIPENNAITLEKADAPVSIQQQDILTNDAASNNIDNNNDNSTQINAVKDILGEYAYLLNNSENDNNSIQTADSFKSNEENILVNENLYKSDILSPMGNEKANEDSKTSQVEEKSEEENKNSILNDVHEEYKIVNDIPLTETTETASVNEEDMSKVSKEPDMLSPESTDETSETSKEPGILSSESADETSETSKEPDILSSESTDETSETSKEPDILSSESTDETSETLKEKEDKEEKSADIQEEIKQSEQKTSNEDILSLGISDVYDTSSDILDIQDDEDVLENDSSEEVLDNVSDNNLGKNINDNLDKIKEIVKAMEEKGINIRIEEFDFESIHQLILIIEK